MVSIHPHKMTKDLGVGPGVQAGRQNSSVWHGQNKPLGERLVGAWWPLGLWSRKQSRKEAALAAWRCLSFASCRGFESRETNSNWGIKRERGPWQALLSPSSGPQCVNCLASTWAEQNSFRQFMLPARTVRRRKTWHGRCRNKILHIRTCDKATRIQNPSSRSCSLNARGKTPLVGKEDLVWTRFHQFHLYIYIFNNIMRNEIPEKAHLLKALASCPSSWTTCGFVPSLAPLAYTAQTFASQACWWDCSKETHAHAHNCDTHSPLAELCKINKTCWGIEWNWFTAHVYCVCLRLRRTSTMPPCQQARKATIFVQATKDPIKY